MLLSLPSGRGLHIQGKWNPGMYCTQTQLGLPSHMLAQRSLLRAELASMPIHPHVSLLENASFVPAGSPNTEMIVQEL